jgi:hypothetical protein
MVISLVRLLSVTLPSVMVPSVSAQSGPSLDGCFVKLGRANKHRQEFAAALGPVLEAVHKGVITETTYDASASQFRVEVLHAPRVDPSLSAIAGDVIQNLRIALEYAAYQALCKFRGRPWRGSFFPIVYNYFGITPRMLRGASDGIRGRKAP